MYYDFEEYVKKRQSKTRPTRQTVDPFLEKPYSKEELEILSYLADIQSQSITPEEMLEDFEDETKDL